MAKMREEEEKKPEEVKLKSTYVKTQLFVLLIIVFILVFLYLALSKGMDFFVKVGERLLIRY